MLKQKLLVLGLFISSSLVIAFALWSKISHNQSYASIKPIQASVGVDAFIGEFQFSLFGYTSPKALVTIEGMGIYDQTSADVRGYFEFHNRFSPLSPREACLSAKDQFGRITSPTCIPPFPIRYNANIGPVLLPPTVSLNSANYYQGDEVKLSGQSIPNTEVTFSTFIDEKKSFTQYLSSIISPKPVEAFTFPQLTSKSDEKGNFSLSIPSSRPEFFRLFAQTSYDNSQSPESIKLNIKILPIWMIIIQLLYLVWSIIKSRLLEIIIIGEILGLALYFLRRYLHPHVVARNRALAIRRLYPIVTEEVILLVSKEYPLVKQS